MLDDDAPGLHADFLIDTGNSADELIRLASIMESTEVKVLAEAQRIERATSNMVDTTAATAGIKAFADIATREVQSVVAAAGQSRAGLERIFGKPLTFSTGGPAATRELQATAREVNKTEAEIEKLIRTLDREAASVGKTRDEQRAMRAEQLALTATTQGNTEAADRLLASMRQLDAARESLAETKLAIQLAAEAGAARERAEAEAQLIAELRERERIQAAIARIDGSDRGRATDVGATFSALAAKAAEDEARATAIAAASAKQLADEHARLADQVRGSQLAMEADAAAAERLRMSTDPLYAATARINAEIAESTRLYYAGATAPAEYARQQIVLTQRLHEASQAHDIMQTAARRGTGSLTQLSFQLNDVATMAMAGSPPFQIFATQIGQIIQVAQQAEGGVKGLAGEIGGFLLRFSPVIGVMAAGTAGFLLFDRAVSKGVDTKAMIAGLGLTKDEIEKLKNTSVSSGDVIKATFQVMASRVGFHLGDMTKFFGDALDWMTKAGRVTLAGLYSMFVGTFRGIAAIVKGVFDGKGIGEILADVGDAYTGAFDEANGAMVRFGEDVTKQIASNKLADMKKQADALKEDRTPKKDRHGEQLEREGRAIEAQIRNLYGLADAYGVSGAEALIAEARVKAESEAIKKRADIEERVARQVRLAVAQRVSDAAKSTAGLNDETRQLQKVNSEVAAGNVHAQLANDLLRERMEDLPLLAAIEAAERVKDVQGIKAATEALDQQREARTTNTDTLREQQRLNAMTSGADRLAELQEELRLVGAIEEVRVRALATLRATQEAAANGWTGKAGADYVAQQVKIAETQFQLAQAQDSFNASLTFTADKWDLIARNVQNAAGGMAEAFGEVGRSIGDVASIYAGFQASRARLDAQHRAEVRKAGSDEAAQQRANTKFAIASATAQVGMFGDLSSAAKGFFKEGSDGYKAMAAAENAFRAIEFALSVRAMAQDAIETASSVARSGVRAAAHAAEAVAKAISSLPFPLNIAAGAATAAVLASIGIAIGGAFGGGSKKDLEPANTGTGTVLGDGKAQSESLKRSIDQLREVDTLTNTFARQMAGSLRSIDSQIGGLAAVLVRGGNVNADSKVAEGFKPNAIGKVLGAIPLIGGVLSSLFGSKTSVIASGIYGRAQSLDQILAGGFDASTYSDVEKKKKFLGITTGTSYATQFGQADAALEQQFTLVLRSFASAIAGAAEPLGQSTAAIEAQLKGFVVNIGKIDLKGLTGAEIQEKLEAVFGAAADSMASAAFPGIERFQKVGEGAFETLVRVASTAEAVTNALGQMGSAARTMSIDAKLALADQFDSIGDLTSAIGGYFEAFYTPAEQTAANTEQLTRVFADLGFTMPATLAAYRELVDAQDLNTSAGQAAYATLIQLAPAFAELQEKLAGAKSAADVAAERADLERRLLELRGDTAALRALELAKLDASNRALQQQIYDLQDAQEAARAADELRKAWSSVGDSIMDEVRRIRGLTDAGGGNSFALLMGQFNAANAKARAGDMEAAKSLPQLSQALLSAAADAATSRQELARVQAQTAAALEATYGVVGALATNKPESKADQIASAVDGRAMAPSSAANDDRAAEQSALRGEIAQLRADMTAGTAAIAANTGRIAKHLDNVTASSGGDAISVEAA
ncbi:hypothetical protein [Sphingomonas olei]|uniref:Bacteriophage tail tape measure N-terminal domain-containing protein n=1 Tax=Sphingomonas olei TaxID=1886787 RepID=A0ABY2QI10_9SPHN|nr:hypothetical protein [Sphingomonas olei]THG40444.1 hypothetical protein E5988_06330 [Sphingomonas olei]